MNISDGEAAGGVYVDVLFQEFHDGAAGSVSNGMRRAVSEAPRDSVQKTVALNKQEIDTEGNVGVVGKDGSRDHFSNERRRAWRSRGAYGISFARRNLGAINDVSPTGVVHSYGAIVQQVVGKDLLEENVAWSAKLRYRARASSAASISRRVDIFFCSATVAVIIVYAVTEMLVSLRLKT